MSKNNELIKLNPKDAIDLNIGIVYSNGLPAIRFIKIVSACDKNMPFLKNVLIKALDEENEIIMPVRLRIVNKFLAKGKLKEAGILLD